MMPPQLRPRQGPLRGNGQQAAPYGNIHTHTDDFANAKWDATHKSKWLYFVLSLVVIKLPYLFSTILVPELSKGMGHHSYGEPAWPNDILYIFPIVIFGIRSYILGLAIREPLNISSYANPFGTPFQILAEWYLFPTLHLLRILSDKFMGILSILAVPTVLLLIPFGENLSRYQNPIRRPIMVSIFLSALIYSIWLSCISLKLTG